MESNFGNGFHLEIVQFSRSTKGPYGFVLGAKTEALSLLDRNSNFSDIYKPCLTLSWLTCLQCISCTHVVAFKFAQEETTSIVVSWLAVCWFITRSRVWLLFCAFARNLMLTVVCYRFTIVKKKRTLVSLCSLHTYTQMVQWVRVCALWS